MCDCNNSLSLVCLCRMNLLRYADTQFESTPSYSNYPLAIPHGTIFRENYTVAGEASQVRRCSVDTWDEYLGPLPKAFATTYLRERVYDVVCDGPRVYIFGIDRAAGGTRMIVLNAATSLIEFNAKIFAGDYTTPGQGFDGSVNAGRISVGPYGVDFFPPGGAKIRIARNGDNWGTPQIVSPFIQLSSIIPVDDVERNKAGWTVYKQEVRFDQPKFNRGGVAIASGVLIRTKAFVEYETFLRVKIGTLNQFGQFVAGPTVWSETFPQVCYAPQVSCASFNGATFWTACGSVDTFGIGVSQVKGFTPWGSYTFGGISDFNPKGPAYFHEVYPDGLAVAWQDGVGAFRYGFTDGTNTWRKDSTAIQRINSDANGIWVTDFNVTGGRMRRYRKDGASYETIALPSSENGILGLWGDPFKDGMGYPGTLAGGRVGVDEAHHGSTPYETYKLDDCFSGGPPSALLG